MIKINIKLIIALILFHFTINGFSQEIIDCDEMWDNIKVSVECDGSQVYSTDKIYLPNETITLMFGNIKIPDYPSMLFFIDDKPNAYWAHDCRYVFVNIKNNNTEIFDHLYPPKFLKEMSLLTPEIEKKEGKLFDFSNIKTKITDEKTVGTNYAVIISGGGNGGSESSFLNDCEAFNSALKIYGYSEDNIYNLISDGSHYSSVTVDYSATIENISLVFDELSGVMTSDDRLFIYLMDHGGPFSADSPDWNVFICIKDGEVLTDRTFAKEVDKISSGKVTTVIGSCNGGGFFDDLSKENRVLISAAKYDEEAYTDDESGYGAFEQYFIAALIEQDVNENPVDADANYDNSISIREAFYYAKDHDDFEETPQYNSRPGELGYKLTLSNESGTMDSQLEEVWEPIEFDYWNDKTHCNPFNADPDEMSNHPWIPSHGSPKFYITSQEYQTDDIYMEAEYISDNDNQKSEGLYIELGLTNNFPSYSSRFNGGHKYEFEISGDLKFEGDLAEGASGVVYLVVVAGYDISASGYSDCGLQVLPEFSNTKVLHSGVPDGFLPGQNGIFGFNYTFEKDENYDQLWIYAYQPYDGNEGGVVISSINITDHGIDIPIEEEAYEYTPDPSSNLICCYFKFVIEGDPPPLIGTECEGGYQWEESLDNDTFTVILGATSKDFDPPILNKTTYYRRVVSATNFSNSVMMEMKPPPPDPVCSSGKQIFSSESPTMKVSHGAPKFGGSNYMGPIVVLDWDMYSNGLGTKYRVSDGVYADYKFIKGSTYLITFFVTQSSDFKCRDYLKIYAANGIQAYSENSNDELPSYDMRQLIWKDRAEISYEWEQFSVSYTPDDDYDHIWIYPIQNEWNCIDRLKNTFSLGNLAIVAENVILGPETFTDVNLVPIDGVNISTSGSTIINSGASLNVVTSNRVTLNKGFKANPGSNFYAKYDDEIYFDCPSKSGVIVNSEIFKDEFDEEIEHKDEIIIIENTSELGNDKTDGGDSLNLAIDNNIIIYPNPTSSSFYIYYNGDINNIELFEVYNSLGSLVETRMPRNNTEEFQFNDKPNGLYFIRIVFNDDSMQFRKILLNK